MTRDVSRTQERTLLGVISGAHGIKGEVKITSFTEDPGSIADFGPLTDKAGAQAFKIRSARVHKANVLIARLDGVTDRNGAEALKGAELFVARDLLPPPETDEFYYSDLIGLAAQTHDGAAFGRVAAVHNFGAGDLLEIALDASKKTVLLPFTKEAVPELDFPGGKLTVVPPEGLLEPAKQDDGREEPEGGEQ